MRRTKGKRKIKLKATFALALALTMLIGVFSFEATANAVETATENGEPYTATIHPEAPPAPFGYGQTWALWNLVLSIVGATLALTVGLRALSEKKRNEHDGFASDEYEKNNATRLAMTLSKLIMAAIGIILFILTQDMRLPMAMADWWTIAHAALFVGGTAIYIFAYRNDRKDRKSGNETSARNAT